MLMLMFALPCRSGLASFRCITYRPTMMSRKLGSEHQETHRVSELDEQQTDSPLLLPQKGLVDARLVSFA